MCSRQNTMRRWLSGLLLAFLSTSAHSADKLLWDRYARETSVRLQACFNENNDTVRHFRERINERQELPADIARSGIVVRIWIDNRGRIKRFSAPLLGDLQLEELLRDIVLTLKPGTPPTDMPMPLLLVVRIPLAA
ncbi:hypothetical protein HC231_12905 [Brenneria izadpanahii]|uniref:TonB C-terminal domain-containing protein n=1 Tax=Brenneria izadpanahii TaxID=2722756 RepID=A0ABX7UVT7_9GAMM|nr:hypothetical protein [Brenneria izadpanahii]QTF08702.1 hypothetical protein HC231_12905 [Brenneria izadpanahii]